MEFKLSNYEVRGYQKRDGRISFHLRTHILFKTNASFSIEAYLKSIRGYLKLPDENEIEFDSISIPVNVACQYNGVVLVHELLASVISELKNIKPCIAKLRFDYEFNFHGAEFVGKLEEDAFIKKMY